MAAVDFAKGMVRTARRHAKTVADLTRGPFAPVHCDACRKTRAHIGFDELASLLEDGELPCPCGDVQVYVGEAGLAEAVAS